MKRFLLPGLTATVALLLVGESEAQHMLRRIDGTQQDGRFGHAVEDGRDVNADGVPDLLIGSPWASSSGLVENGNLQVISGEDFSLIWSLDGPVQTARFGWSTSTAGDVDGDGHDDFLVGAISWGGLGRFQLISGADAALMFELSGGHNGNNMGRSIAGGLNLLGHEAVPVPDWVVGADMGYTAGWGETLRFNGADFRFAKNGGYSFDHWGVDVVLLRDINGDSFADFARAGASRVEVISGRDLLVLHQWSGFSGRSGQLLSLAAGDVDGDGLDDVLVGNQFNSDQGTDAGKVEIYSGATFQLIHTFYGDAAGDQFGTSVGVADVTGDGSLDLLVGAPYADGGLVDSGAVYQYDGPDFQLRRALFGDSSGDRFGFSLSALGDLDADGAPEYCVGAPDTDFQGLESGSVYVYSGRPTVSSSDECFTLAFTGSLDSQILQANEPPPKFDPLSWVPVERANDFHERLEFSCSGQNWTSLTGALEYGQLPVNLAVNNYESDDYIRVFSERTDHVLAQDVRVNFTEPGFYFEGAQLSQEWVPAGTVVSSYLLHFDSSDANPIVLTGCVEFDEPVVGVIVLDQELDDSDAELGHASITYPPPGFLHRGLELDTQDDDTVTLQENRRHICLHALTTTRMDQIRVITGAPEPLEMPFVNSEGYMAKVDEVTLDNCGSAFYRWTFELPPNYENPELSGFVNADDQAVLYLNGNQVSGSLTMPLSVPNPMDPLDPNWALLDTGKDLVDGQGRPILTAPTPDNFRTEEDAYFRAGENELVLAVIGDASYWEPTGVEFVAKTMFDAFYVLEVGTMTAGGVANASLRGATPDSTQYLVYSVTGRGRTHVSALGVTLGLENPILGATAVADVDGRAAWSVPIPTGASGVNLWVQAAEQGRVTNIVESVIQ